MHGEFQTVTSRFQNTQDMKVFETVLAQSLEKTLRESEADPTKLEDEW